MGKSVSAKASEKRRRQRVKAESKLGHPVRALAKEGALPGAAKKNKPAGKKKRAKLIRQSLAVGDVDSALEVFRQSDVGAPVCVDLAISCLNAGRALDACTAVQRMVEGGGNMHLISLISAFTKMSQRCELSEIMRFVEMAVPHVKLDGPPEHLAYLKHFVPLLVMEYMEGAQQSMEKIRSRGISSLAAAGEAVGQLRAEVSNKKTSQITLMDDRLGPYTSACPRESNFFKGDIVYLERRSSATQSAPACPDYNAHDQPGRHMEELEAEVVTLVPTFTLRALGSAAAAANWDGAQVDVFRLANRLTFIRQLAALQTLLSRQKRKGCLLHDVLCPGFGEPTPEACAAATACVPRLCASPPPEVDPSCLHHVAAQVPLMQQHNSSQHAALQAAVTGRLTLIQGPPGTGKTTTAISLISLWLLAGRGPVLATSDSNIAVDNLLEGCIRAGMRVVRLGRAEAVRPDLNDYMLENQARQKCPGGPAADRTAFHQAMQSILKQASVVCATCSGAGGEIVSRCSFPSVLLDEASQATEPSSLIPLMKDAAQVALVGDHKQLPPTIVSREAELAGLNVSLFDRMVAAGVQPFMLDTQYRMHPGLAAFPAKAFYGGLLKTGVAAAQRPRPAGFAWPSPYIPIAFAPCDHGREDRVGNSYQNSAEAAVVAAIVNGILAARELSPADIGVVTPYASQVRVLRQYLNVRRTPGVPTLEVSSVDAFQGREKEVIVFSAVRSNASGSVGFLADARRVNVMLTRAKRGLVVVGSGPTLSHEPTVWGPWLRWAIGCGLVAGFPPVDATKVSALASGDFSGSVNDVGDIKMAAPAPAPSSVSTSRAGAPAFLSMERHIPASHSAVDLRGTAPAAATVMPLPNGGSSRWGAHAAALPPIPVAANPLPNGGSSRWGPAVAHLPAGPNPLPPLPAPPSDPSALPSAGQQPLNRQMHGGDEGQRGSPRADARPNEGHGGGRRRSPEGVAVKAEDTPRAERKSRGRGSRSRSRSLRDRSASPIRSRRSRSWSRDGRSPRRNRSASSDRGGRSDSFSKHGKKRGKEYRRSRSRSPSRRSKSHRSRRSRSWSRDDRRSTRRSRSASSDRGGRSGSLSPIKSNRHGKKRTKEHSRSRSRSPSRRSKSHRHRSRSPCERSEKERRKRRRSRRRSRSHSPNRRDERPYRSRRHSSRSSSRDRGARRESHAY